MRTRYPDKQVVHLDTLVYEHDAQLETAQVKHLPELDGVIEKGLKQVLQVPFSWQVSQGFEHN